MPSMPGGEYADQAQEHMKSTSDLVVKYLSPVEEMSPFKVGQIQKLIADVNEQAGTAVAPFFIVLQVLFLLAFVGYLVVAIVALALDWEAMDCDCASDSWVWLYVLLVVVIPTSYGFVMGLIKTGLALADVKEIPDLFTTLPAPIIYITLGILGIILWSTMDGECEVFYSTETGMLFVIFKIQVGVSLVRCMVPGRTLRSFDSPSFSPSLLTSHSPSRREHPSDVCCFTVIAL